MDLRDGATRLHMIQFDADLEPSTSDDPARLPGQLGGWLSPASAPQGRLVTSQLVFIRAARSFGEKVMRTTGGSGALCRLPLRKSTDFQFPLVVYERSEVIILTFFIVGSERHGKRYI